MNGARRGLAGLLACALLAACSSGPPLLRGEPPADASAGTVVLGDVPFFAQEQYQCGPAALAMLLGQSGIAIAPAELVPEVYLPTRLGSLQTELVAAVRRHERLPYTLADALSEAPQDAASALAALTAQLAHGHAVLVLQNLGLRSVPIWHYAVVIGFSPADDAIILHTGDRARLALRARDFDRSWALAGRWAMVALKPGELPAQPDADRYVEAAAGLESTGHFAAARAAYGAALLRWPGHASARLGLANTLQAMGDSSGAETGYRTLLEAEPHDRIAPIARNNLATLLAVRGCRDEALVQIAAALAEPDIDPALRERIEQTRAEIESYPQSSSACSSASISA